MYQNSTINGFSKLTKEEKLKLVSDYFNDSEIALNEFKEFWHPDLKKQKLFDEFSENTISNFYIPFGVAPNITINGSNYMVPMVIEESSVIAAASSSAKFWAKRGGFKARVISTEKIGQVHFLWKGNIEKLKTHFEELKKELRKGAQHLTSRMEERGGGISEINLVDLTDEIDYYYQLKVSFQTANSMGANFINSCLEEFATILEKFISQHPDFSEEEKNCEIVMSILSNYTPNCLVESWVECEVDKLKSPDIDLSPEEFAKKFELAVKIAEIDVNRATTHNKGIFNGIDAVALATGNDFRAIEAGGHTYAASSGKYKSLTSLSLKDGIFKYSLKVPLALGTVGGLTKLHPLAKRSLELLGNPDAEQLMMIMATTGLANNFGAVKSLVTKGIQQGHMKMHLFNILNQYHATEAEKSQAKEFFKERKVSVKDVSDFLGRLRQLHE